MPIVCAEQNETKWERRNVLIAIRIATSEDDNDRKEGVTPPETTSKDQSQNENLVHPFTAAGKLGENTSAIYELLIGALLSDPPIVHDRNPVTHLHDLQLVRDHEGRPADLCRRDGLQHRSLVGGVQR